MERTKKSKKKFIEISNFKIPQVDTKFRENTFSKMKDGHFSKIQEYSEMNYEHQNIVLPILIFFEISRFVFENEIFGSRTVQLFYFIRSSYDINRYIPRCLRVSWWTLRQHELKKQFKKSFFLCPGKT